MSTVKLSLKTMTVPEKIQFARRVADALEAHSGTFPDQPSSFDELRDYADTLETAFNTAAVVRAQAKEWTSATANAEEALGGRLMLDARYVQNVSGGNAQIIGLAGMDVRATPQPVGLLPAPQGVSATAGEFARQVTLKWSPVPKAASYTVERTTTPNAPHSWQIAAASTKAKAAVTGLTSGTKHWFRIAAINTVGPGLWSAVVMGVAG
jgi:hypothetical protein